MATQRDLGNTKESARESERSVGGLGRETAVESALQDTDLQPLSVSVHLDDLIYAGIRR